MIKIEENELFNERYRLISLLGVGGYSQVWLAEDTDINKEVALKIFATGYGLDSETLMTFSREYSKVFDLNHSNLLIPKHLDKWEKMPYLVMPYFPKGSCLKLCGKMDETELAKFLLQIGEALQYLHSQEPPIVHQNIKPDNILIDNKGNYLLTDFEISTKIRRTLTKSIGQKTANIGTTAYTAPEKFSVKLSDKAPIKANDIFSLGVCMFELLTDELPCGNLGGILLSSNGHAAKLPENYSPNLQKLIAACLSKDTWERPTAEELVEVAKNYQKVRVWSMPKRIAPSNQINENNIDKAIVAGDFERFVSHSDFSVERINIFFDFLNERYGNIDRVGFELYLKSILDDVKEKEYSKEVIVGQSPQEKAITSDGTNKTNVLSQPKEQTPLERAIASKEFEKYYSKLKYKPTDAELNYFHKQLTEKYGKISFNEFNKECKKYYKPHDKTGYWLIGVIVFVIIMIIIVISVNSIDNSSFSSGNSENSEDAEVNNVSSLTENQNNTISFFIDPRDNRKYSSVKIGNQIWMAENMAFLINDSHQKWIFVEETVIDHEIVEKSDFIIEMEKEINESFSSEGEISPYAYTNISKNCEWECNELSDGWCYYNNDTSLLSEYGVLYQWEAAKRVCPPGWHLPSEEEWLELKQYLSKDGASGIKLKSKNIWPQSSDAASNESGFSAKPGGYCHQKGVFMSHGNEGWWWTATSEDSDIVVMTLDGQSYGLNTSSTADKNAGCSVRCMKD